MLHHGLEQNILVASITDTAGVSAGLIEDEVDTLREFAVALRYGLSAGLALRFFVSFCARLVVVDASDFALFHAVNVGKQALMTTRFNFF